MLFHCILHMLMVGGQHKDDEDDDFNSKASNFGS
jgi:hypothetical protein